MKNTRIAWMGLLLIAMLVAAPFSATAASKTPSTIVKIKTHNVNLFFDGQELKLPEGRYTFLYEERTYVPIRYISYALLKQVGWKDTENKVTVSEPTEEELVELKKELQLAGADDAKPKEAVTIPFRKIEAKLVFDGVEKKLPAGQSIFIYDGTIYVPVRFLSESVGAEIGWDPKTWTVIGESPAYRAALEEAKQDAESEEDSEASEEQGAGEGNVVNPGAGGGGGAPAVKPTYEQITTSAEASLQSLRASCQATLISMGLDYTSAADADKATIRAQIEGEVNNCTVKFNAIIADTTAKLTANGYSTDIIEEYKAEFEAELEAGRKIAESL